MRRLYLQVYLTIVASLVLVVLTAGLLGTSSRAFPRSASRSRLRARSSPSLFLRRMRRLGFSSRRSTGWRCAWARIWRCSPQQRAAGRRRPPLPAPSRGGRGGWLRAPGGPAVSIPLRDGRWLVARMPPRHRPSALVLAAFLGAIALAVALGAFPIVRRLTGRLERLQHGVESLGAGDLARASRSRAATRSRVWPRASIRRPGASRAWSTLTSCCSPMRPMS